MCWEFFHAFKFSHNVKLSSWNKFKCQQYLKNDCNIKYIGPIWRSLFGEPRAFKHFTQRSSLQIFYHRLIPAKFNSTYLSTVWLLLLFASVPMHSNTNSVWEWFKNATSTHDRWETTSRLSHRNENCHMTMSSLGFGPKNPNHEVLCMNDWLIMICHWPNSSIWIEKTVIFQSYKNKSAKDHVVWLVAGNSLRFRAANTVDLKG